MSKRVIALGLIAYVMSVFLLSDPSVTATIKHKYVGANRCALCHKTRKLGKQFQIWSKTRHAQAYRTLGTGEAREIAEREGVEENPQKSPACLRCHVTGYGEPPEAFADSYAIEEGVSCETCHGAGSDFSKVEIMKNTARAMSLGLIIDRTGEQCLQCHNPSSPTWREDRFTTKEGKNAGFDYKSALELIKHPLKN